MIHDIGSGVAEAWSENIRVIDALIMISFEMNVLSEHAAVD